MPLRSRPGLSLPLSAALLVAACAAPPSLPPVHADFVPRSGPVGPEAGPGAEPRVPPTGRLSLMVEEAILLALENNRGLSVQRLEPAIQRTFEEEEASSFDPLVSAEVSEALERAPAVSGDRDTTGYARLGGSVSQRLPGGTDLSAGVATDLETSDLRDDRTVTRLGLTVNQALLRGAGLDVSLVDVRQARLDTLASEYELRGFAEVLVADTEATYWNLALAKREIEIVTDSLVLAQRQLAEIRERIAVGRMAETELSAAEAEVALRRENLINARSALAATRLRLLRILNLGDGDPWERELVIASRPAEPNVSLDDVAVHVEVALRMRPDLNQARLLVQRGELELVKTRNGLLPRLDLFITLGKSGYADTFGGGFTHLGRGDYDLGAGLTLELPLGNRAAKARNERAEATREQALAAVENLSQLVQVDVRSAYIEVLRTREQVTATAATRRLQEESLRAEQEKLRVGKSTSYLVAQAQRDFLVGQIAEVRAVVARLQALIGLHLSTGTLLERRGVSGPGADPVTLAGPESPSRAATE